MKKKITLTFIILIFISAFFSFLFHEFGHWTIGELLGNKMIMNLNGAYPKGDRYIHEWNSIFVYAGGPLFTVVQAIISLYLVNKYKKLFIYPFLFFPFIMRLFAFLFGTFKIQDEALMSSKLNIGTYTLPIIIIIILSILVWKGSSTLKLNLKFNLFCTIYSIIFMVILIYTNQILFGNVIN
jgi:hypothetical protein